MVDPKMLKIFSDTYDRLDKGDYCLSGMIKTILSEKTTDQEALLAFTVVTAWLAKNEPKKCPAVLDLLRPIMEIHHPDVMSKKND